MFNLVNKFGELIDQLRDGATVEFVMCKTADPHIQKALEAFAKLKGKPNVKFILYSGNRYFSPTFGFSY